MEDRGVLRGIVSPSGAIPAASVSALLGPYLDPDRGVLCGHVLSVHRSAVNVLVNGVLITIVSARAGGLPNGVLVAEPFDPRSLGVRADMPVTIDRGRLAIEDGRLVVDAVQAPRWRPQLRPLPVPRDLGLRAAIAERAAAGRPGGLDGMVFAADSFGALAAAMGSGSDAAVVRAGRNLVGLGAGLTPAGDDVLVGLTAGLTALGDSRGTTFAGAWAQHAIGRTTVVAESGHRHAAIGAYNERIHDVLRAIVGAPTGAIPVAVQVAAAWGATSGVDTLAGIALALRAHVDAAELGAA